MYKIVKPFKAYESFCVRRFEHMKKEEGKSLKDLIKIKR